MTNIIARFIRARGAYWRTEDETTLGALFCILQADVRALPIAWQELSRNGRPPMRLDAWADAVEAAYLSGF